MAAHRYANVRTKTDRFGKDFKDKMLDVVYDTDTGHKMTMTTACARSPINYANMSSTVSSRHPLPVIATLSRC